MSAPDAALSCRRSVLGRAAMVALVLGVAGGGGLLLLNHVLSERGCNLTAERAEMSVIRIALLTYKNHQRAFPEELAFLVAPPPRSRGFVKSYLSAESLMDPWGQPYRYRLLPAGGGGEPFELYSVGPDGKDGTGDDERLR